MLSINPKFILRNYLAQVAIDNYTNHPEVLNNLFKVMAEPFSEWPEFEEWSKPAPPQFKNLEVSCSS